MYRLWLWWFWTQAAPLAGRDEARKRRRRLLESLESGSWGGPQTYDFWWSIGQGCVFLAAEVGMVAAIPVLAFRPDGANFRAAMALPGAVFGFALGGCLAVAPAIFASWYRRNGSKPLAPMRRSAGWWMLAVQVPAAALVALMIGRSG